MHQQPPHTPLCRLREVGEGVPGVRAERFDRVLVFGRLRFGHGWPLRLAVAGNASLEILVYHLCTSEEEIGTRERLESEAQNQAL